MEWKREPPAGEPEARRRPAYCVAVRRRRMAKRNAKAQIIRALVAGSGTGDVLEVIVIVPDAAVKSRLLPLGSAKLVVGKSSNVTANAPGVAPGATSNRMLPSATVAPLAMLSPAPLLERSEASTVCHGNELM